MSIATATREALEQASWIRRMFEAGRELKQRLGEDNVFDFSLGNPILEPPEAFQNALRELTHTPPAGVHRYTPNNGFPSTRRAVAAHLSEEQGVAIDADDIVMTVGAAGALHVALRSILEPGDEVVLLSPYFVEYLFYARWNGGVPVVVETTDTFDLDIDAIAAKLTDKTRAILVNTPNNPTGRMYRQETIRALAELLSTKEREFGRDIYLLFDTPYAKLTYEGRKNPLLFTDHPNTLLAHSHSKDLGLAGERIGYLTISPRVHDREDLRAACVFNNRVLGFVNAPALMQLALERSLSAMVDVEYYRTLRDKLTGGLRAAGYQFSDPDGAFYLFPKTPIADDVAFVEILRDENVLTVPGRGFGREGHIRIAFCVTEETIDRALPRFARAMQRAQESR